MRPLLRESGHGSLDWEEILDPDPEHPGDPHLRFQRGRAVTILDSAHHPRAESDEVAKFLLAQPVLLPPLFETDH